MVRLMSRPIAESCSGIRAAISRTEDPTLDRSLSPSSWCTNSSSLGSDPFVFGSKGVLIEILLTSNRSPYEVAGSEVHYKNLLHRGQTREFQRIFRLEFFGAS